MRPFRRVVAVWVAVCLAGTTCLSTASAGVIGTEEMAAQEMPAASEHQARLIAALDRADVVSALKARGVDPQAARERVAALTDAEASLLVAEIDRAPAGADVLGTLVFIFVLLLVTDILGLTKVFPFTRSVR